MMGQAIYKDDQYAVGFLNHFQLNKELLVEFDLANCQPLLLSYLFGKSKEIQTQSESGNFFLG